MQAESKDDITSINARSASFRRFLQGGPKERNYIILDPSSYAADFNGKFGGYATLEDNLRFHSFFPNDAPISEWCQEEKAIPELKWTRALLSENEDEKMFAETLKIPAGIKKRVVAERKGTTPWLVEPAVKKEEDFDLIDYYADCIREHAQELAARSASNYQAVKQQGFMTEGIVLTAFEAYYLIDYPDMPLMYYDFPERYRKSIAKIQAANIMMIEALAAAGAELFGMGSAGLELLSPKIFDEAIVPFARETTDLIRAKGLFSAYHICGHSRQLIESGRINAIKPTWFETFSTRPCGDNTSLSDSLKYLDPEIVSKGNLPLELLRNGSPADISRAVHEIIFQSRGRRHIIGQADGTVLSDTPKENLIAYLEAAK